MPNKAVVVTGCSSGIGRAVATHLATLGYPVFATVRRERDAAALAELGIDCLIPLAPLDLTTRDHLEPIVERVAAELGRRGLGGLYALINNAGGGGPAPIELLDLVVLQRELQTRVVGAVALVQALLPFLRAGQGRVLWIATPALVPTPYVASIHAADFAVNCIARTLDIELQRWRIPNVLVRCGGIRTPAGLRTTQDVEDLLSRVEPDRAELYAPELAAWATEMAEFDERRTDVARVAAVVERALRAKVPKRRYSVGHMARLAAVLELLPQGLADLILRRRFAPRRAPH